MKIWTLLIALITSTDTPLFPADPKNNFSLVEIPVFQPSSLDHCEILEMGYASHIIRNPEVWENHNRTRQVYKIDIIFTKYPYHKKDWIIHYDSLLEKRIRAICSLDPAIDRYAVTWNLILQTDCRTEEEAKNLFHGAAIWYREVPLEKRSMTPAVTVKKEVRKVKVVVEEVKASSDINELTSGSYSFLDSTVFKVLERNCWKDMLIVNDWTASMYQYGAQALLWHQKNLDKKLVSRFVFFNDGDRKKVKRTGCTGGIYFASASSIDQVVRVMKKVQKNGTGGDMPENDIEALLKACEKTKSFKEVILIADNKSAVKDMSLLKQLNVPVRVIVCGLKKGQAIHHDYLQIASATKGSVHTIEEDVYDLSQLKEGERVTIQNIEYQRVRGRIVKAKRRVAAPVKASL